MIFEKLMVWSIILMTILVIFLGTTSIGSAALMVVVGMLMVYSVLKVIDFIILERKEDNNE